MEKSHSEPSVTTDIFKMPAREMLGILFLLHGRAWAIGCGVALAAFAVAAIATADIRWGICALMFLCIVCPAIMAFLYINYAIHPDCAFNALPHSLEFLHDSIRITIIPSRPKGKTDEATDGLTDEKIDNHTGCTAYDTAPADAGGDLPEEEERKPIVRHIQLSEIRQIDLPIIKFGRNGHGFIYITPKAFADMADYRKCIGRLSKNMQPHHPNAENYYEE